MDQEEEDWGETIWFQPFEDKCTLSYSCAGRVMEVLTHVRDIVFKAPEHDPTLVIAGGGMWTARNG